MVMINNSDDNAATVGQLRDLAKSVQDVFDKAKDAIISVNAVNESLCDGVKKVLEMQNKTNDQMKGQLVLVTVVRLMCEDLDNRLKVIEQHLNPKKETTDGNA